MKKFILKAVPFSQALRQDLGEEWAWYYGKSPWRRGPRRLFVHSEKEKALALDKCEADKAAASLANKDFTVVVEEVPEQEVSSNSQEGK